MLKQQGFKFLLKPTDDEIVLLNQFLGSARFVWNNFLALNEELFESGETRLSYKKMSALLPAFKEKYPFLKMVSAQILQQKVKDLKQGYSNYYNPKLPQCDKPVWKKKFNDETVRFPQSFKVTNNAVYLEKIGHIGFVKTQDILGTPKSITVSRKCNRFYVSILTERWVEEPVHPNPKSAVGLDLGEIILIALSTGKCYFALNAYKKNRNKLAELKRILSQQVKFSKNWKKTKVKIGKLENRIKNIRHDLLHKITTEIAKNHGIVAMEDLRIVEMMKSAKGTIDNPGTDVKKKSKQNQRIQDQGWGYIRVFLTYKLRWNGGELILVDPAYTSRICSNCGFQSKENRKTQENFDCLRCEFQCNADINAAKNVLSRAGHCPERLWNDAEKQRSESGSTLRCLTAAHL